MLSYGVYFAVLLSQAGHAIFGGQAPKPNDLIWRSSVGVAIEWGPGRSGDCSGVLIDRNVVVTAAHCVLDEDGRESLPKKIRFFDGGGKVALERKVLNAAVPVNYSPTDLAPDVAVVSFEGSLPSSYAPVSLLRDRKRLVTNTDLLVAGVGFTERRGFEGLRFAKLRAVHVEEDIFSAVNSTRLSRGTAGLCGGDSGGPAYIEIGDKLFLAGIASTSEFPDCSRPSGFNKFTIVPGYADEWIARAINQLTALPGAGQVVR